MALPSQLTNVELRQGNGKVLISWDFAPGTTSYNVSRSTDQITYTQLTPATNTPSWTDSTVTVGVEYFYKVAGVNASGTGLFSIAQNIVPTYSGEMTLGQLRLLSKQKADRVNSQFVTDVEWDVYINQSYFELYDLLVQKYGNDYFVDKVEFNIDGSTQYALPNGSNYPTDGINARPFYKLLGMDLQIAAASNAWLTLKKYEFISRNRYVYPQLATNLLGVAGLRYRLVGGNVQFIPMPSSGQIVRMWYVPRMITLLSDNDIVDGVSGWTEYIAIDAAIKALAKEESDTQVLQLAKQQLTARIEAAAENRDAGEPETISSTRRWGDSWGWGDGGDTGGPIGGI